LFTHQWNVHLLPVRQEGSEVEPVQVGTGRASARSPYRLMNAAACGQLDDAGCLHSARDMDHDLPSAIFITRIRPAISCHSSGVRYRRGAFAFAGSTRYSAERNYLGAVHGSRPPEPPGQYHCGEGNKQA
jgi:hypothetical protein